MAGGALNRLAMTWDARNFNFIGPYIAFTLLGWLAGLAGWAGWLCVCVHLVVNAQL